MSKLWGTVQGKLSKTFTWFDFSLLPTLKWKNGKTVERNIIEWWAVLAEKLKDPKANELFQRYIALLDANSQKTLSLPMRFSHVFWLKKHLSYRVRPRLMSFSAAKAKVAACFALADLTKNGMGMVDALEKVATDMSVSTGSLKRWFYRVKNFERSDWLPLLLGNYKDGAKRTAEFTPEAWEAFKADYLRLEAPDFAMAHERLKLLAKEHDWKIPSASIIKRKLKREVTIAEQVYLREGEHALSELYSSLIRTVADIEALSWINGDGYQHNVFVRFPDGEIKRPKTWVW